MEEEPSVNCNLNIVMNEKTHGDTFFKADYISTLESGSEFSLVSECYDFDISEALSEISRTTTTNGKNYDNAENTTFSATVSQLKCFVATKTYTFKRYIPEYFQNLQPAFRNQSTVTSIHNSHGIPNYIKDKIVQVLAENIHSTRDYYEDVSEQIRNIFINEAHLQEKDAAPLTKRIINKAQIKSRDTCVTESYLKEMIQKEVEDLHHTLIVESLGYMTKNEDSSTGRQIKTNQIEKSEVISSLVHPSKILENSDKQINNISQCKVKGPRLSDPKNKVKRVTVNEPKSVSLFAGDSREAFFNSVYGNRSEIECSRKIITSPFIDKENDTTKIVSVQTIDSKEEHNIKAVNSITNCLKNEIGQVLLKAILSECAKNIPLEQGTTEEQLQRQKLLTILTKSLQKIVLDQKYTRKSETNNEELWKENDLEGKIAILVKNVFKLHTTEKTHFFPTDVLQISEVIANKCTGTTSSILSEQKNPKTKAFENKITQISNVITACTSTFSQDSIDGTNEIKCAHDFNEIDKADLSNKWLPTSYKLNKRLDHVAQKYGKPRCCLVSDSYEMPCSDPCRTRKKDVWGDYDPGPGQPSYFGSFKQYTENYNEFGDDVELDECSNDHSDDYDDDPSDDCDTISSTIRNFLAKSKCPRSPTGRLSNQDLTKNLCLEEEEKIKIKCSSENCNDTENLVQKLFKLRGLGLKETRKLQGSDLIDFDDPCLRHRGRPLIIPAADMQCDCTRRIIISPKGTDGYLDVCEVCGTAYPILL